ncbi:MAG: hypothetical protein AAF656_09590 [Planctomycetota bacterium]
MSAEPPDNALHAIVEILDRHDVQFVVIGGRAENLLGSPRVTYDTDVAYERSPENRQRLVEALREMNAKLRNVPADVPFMLDERTLGMGMNFTFETDFGDFDVLGEVQPIGDYHALLEDGLEIELDSRPVWIIGLDDLIRVKQYIGRGKDRQSLMQLLALRAIRDGDDDGET